jgi:hypothetical protein
MALHQPSDGPPLEAGLRFHTAVEEEMLTREPTRPAKKCVCGKDIVELSSGEHRSTESDPRVDRAACEATGNGRHQPRPAGNEERAVMRRASPPWSDSTRDHHRTGDLP